jgi:preprotein translocase subunit SecY
MIKLETLKNIWSVKELKKKILFTLAMLLIYRIGTHIVLPGISSDSLAQLKQSTDGGLLGIFNMFAGGAFSNASIFALGVMPYISASIAVQLLGFVFPYFKKMQMEGESGRRSLNQITRYLTVAFTMFQGIAYMTYLKSLGIEPSNGIGPVFFSILTMFVLTAGTLFVVWLGERITDNGLGNGVSIIIMAGIMARLPIALYNEVRSKVSADSGGLVLLLIEMILFVVVIMAVILILQAVRRIAVNYARKIVSGGGSVIPGRRSAPVETADMEGSVRQYLPLKLNTAGVMPIIFAQAIMFIPSFVAQGLKLNQNTSFWINITNVNGWIYNLIVFIMVVVMTFLYTAIVMSPTQMADDLKRNNGFIPGIKPGAETADYIDKIISYITFPGSFFSGLIAILPYIITTFLKVDPQWASFYGGTSLLIAVGVILDTILQVEGYLLNKKYDGLTDYNKMSGRQTVA